MRNFQTEIKIHLLCLFASQLLLSNSYDEGLSCSGYRLHEYVNWVQTAILPWAQDTQFYHLILQSSLQTQRIRKIQLKESTKMYVRCNVLITCEHVRDDRLEGELEDVVYKVLSVNLPDLCPSSCKHPVSLFIIIHLLLLKWCIHLLIQITQEIIWLKGVLSSV